MLTVERISVMNFENAMRGARNPLFTFLFYAAYPLHLLALVAIRAMRLVPPYFLR